MAYYLIPLGWFDCVCLLCWCSWIRVFWMLVVVRLLCAVIVLRLYGFVGVCCIGALRIGFVCCFCICSVLVSVGLGFCRFDLLWILLFVG